MENDKSPRADAYDITCELGTFFTRAIYYSTEVMHFSEPNKLGIITCIP